MTFPTKLERLLKEATEGPWTARVDETVTLRDAQDNQLAIFTHLHTKTGGRRDANEVAKNARLCALLRNHAPAILELVRAAEVAEQTLRNGGIFPIKGITWKALNSALAKLNGGKG